MSTFCILVKAAMKFCCKDYGKKEGHQSILDVSGKSITLKSSGYLGVARKNQERCFQSQQSHCVCKRKGLKAHGGPRTQAGRLSCVGLVPTLSLRWWNMVGEGLRQKRKGLAPVPQHLHSMGVHRTGGGVHSTGGGVIRCARGA